MIINRTTKEWQMCSYTDKNNTNWPDDMVWNVADDSEIAAKVMQAGPKWEAVTDSDGNLIDCLPDVSVFVEDAKNSFRNFRKQQFAAFDIYKTNIDYGVILETPQMHDDILLWYDTMLAFTDEIDETNYESIVYPVTPQPIRAYL